MAKSKNKIELKVGALLLAEPFLEDPHFRRSVVLVCERNKDGTLGFILNKPVGINISNLLSSFPEFKSEVYYGGPVQTDTIHYLHNKGDLIQDSVEIEKGLFWGGKFDEVIFCVENGLITPLDIKFFVGYSGWGQGQIEEEMSYNNWMIGEVDRNYVFNTNKSEAKSLWSKVLENEGDVYSVIAQMPLPNWN
jgi:putative transcriptional regulator